MRYIEAKNLNEIQTIVSTLGSILAVDCETTSKDPRTADLLKIIIANTEQAVCFSGKYVEYLSTIENNTLIFQNFNYDFKVLRRYGVDLFNTKFYDIMLMHHLIDENVEHSLDAMVQHYYQDNYKEVFWDKYQNYTDAPPKEAIEYECKDGIYTAKLYQKYNKVVDQDLNKHVHRLAKALYLTEVYGVNVNVDLMLDTKLKMGNEIAEYLPQLREEFKLECDSWEYYKWKEEIDKRKTTKGKLGVKKPDFNFASDTQVSWIVYDCLSLPILKKTKKGNASTDSETIEKLETYEPRLKTLKDYKAIKSIYATYVEGLLEKVKDDKIFPQFNVNGTETGRISHSNPNMGNMPTDGIIRNFFLPSPACKLIGADYEQLEINIAANMSGDRELTRSLLEGVSLHDITSDALKIDRDKAKAINFAIQYGAGIKKISLILKISFNDAQDVLNRYWLTYAGLKTLIDYCHKCVENGTPIKNPFGRERHFPMYFETEWQLAAAKRQAFNALIQGTGGDITHRAFYLMSERLQKNGHGRMLWEVHDEEIADIKEDYCEEEKQVLVETMQDVSKYLNFKIPLKAKPYGPLDFWKKI